MPSQELFSLVVDLWNDLQRPDVPWQVAALLGCLGAAWLVARLLRRRQVDLAGGWQFGQGGVKRVLFPLLALLFVVVVRHLLRPWLHVNLLNVAIPLLGSLAGIRAVFYVLRVSFAPSGWLAAFERTFSLLVWAGVALYIVGLLPAVVDALEGIGFKVGNQHLNVWLMVQGAATVVVTVFVALWVGSLVDRQIMAARDLDNNLRVVFVRLSKALLMVVAVLIALPMVGIDLTTLSVFGGALGVGLGFGLQKIASNYVSGFIILLDRSIRIGNMISVGGDRGQVTQITTRYTVLRGLTGIEAIVPNEILVGSVVQNESYTDPKVRVSVPVQVNYGCDVERALAILVEAARGQSRVLVEPGPGALCLSFADSGINLELGFWIDDPEEGTGPIRSAINLEILRRFRDAGIEIPYPQREIRILNNAATN